MKIDLHVHCSERSKCSIATEEEHILSAIEHKLDAIVITDHNKLVPEEHLKELNEKYYPFKIFGGIEIRTQPHGDDVLVIGVKEELLQNQKWNYDKLYKFVKPRGGFIVLCHPYRYGDTVNIDIATFVPDAIELHSTNIGKCDNKRIRTLASRLGSKLVADSDGHNKIHTGIFYNEIEGNPQNEAELAKLLLEKPIILKADEERVKLFNKEIIKKEALVKKMISEGKTAENYHNETGEWEGYFNRVLIGKSYEI